MIRTLKVRSTEERGVRSWWLPRERIPRIGAAFGGMSPLACVVLSVLKFHDRS